MNLGLENKVAFVAGASSGLGLASATALVSEGCRVAICSRNKESIEAARGRIIASTGVSPDKVIAMVCDVTDESQIASAIEKTVKAFGKINILFTNAGSPPTGMVGTLEADVWRSGLELNLVSTINLCRHSLPFLREAAENEGHARIIMVTSIAAKQPVESLYISNTGRAGIQGFAKTLSEELGRDGITVNTILPGFTRTEHLQNLARKFEARTGTPVKEVEKSWSKGAALKRLGEPEEFSATVAFLASKQAAFITGIALPVDGGYSKHVL